MRRFTLNILWIFLLMPFLGYSQDVLISDQGTVVTCSGNFYDSGGGSGNYTSNEDYTITICPENSGQMVQLDFTWFSTQTNADILTIYNGDDDTAPATTYSGPDSNSPGFVAANNSSGCLTINFTSDNAASTSGWEAEISCYEPCQDITGSIDSTTPAPDADGNILVCPGGQVDFFGSGTFSNSSADATYTWDFGDGNSATGQNATHVFEESGIYSVGLTITDTNPLGCSSEQVGQIVLVAPSIDFTGTEATKPNLCFGDSTTILGVAETTQLEDCAPEIFEQTWLQDTQSTGSGVSYESTINVECYADNLALTDVSQLLQICVVIEHSFIGDLDMFLTSPTGQTVYFAQYGDGNDPGYYLGQPIDNDATGNPGVGWNYCFAPTSTQDISSSVGANNTIPAGTYGASGSSSFADLIGSPLNGDWTFTVVDSWAIDDGTLFSWNLDFDPSLSAPPSQIVSQEWNDDTSITSVDGNNIVVTPTEAGEHCYTYVVLDDFGCEYSETVCISMAEEIITESPENLNICDEATNSFIFDFTTNQDLILSIAPDPSQLNLSFYQSIEDAESESNPISNIDSFDGSDDQMIYARVDYADTDCYEISSFMLNVIPYPEINDIDDQTLCDTVGNGEVEFDLNSLTQDILGDLEVSDYTTTYYLSESDAENSSNELSSTYAITDGLSIYTRVDALDTGCGIYTTDPIITFTVLPGDDSSFALTATCDGATAEITGVTGGAFAFVDPPADGAVIDTATGVVTGGDYGSTYNISYTSDDLCPTTTVVPITTILADDSSFALTATCDGATAEITGVTGGAFAFVDPPADGAVIDTATGVVTGGDYGSTYNISYTSDDLCPTTTVVPITTILADDSSFALTATCDGATAEITGVTGGAFAFVDPPADGAVIDTATGVVTGGDYGSTYNISYTSDDLCPTTTVVPITTILADDSSFALTATCDGATAEITGVTGGAFAFVDPPADGAVIDTATGVVTGGDYGSTYNISYTSDDLCPTTTVVPITTILADDSSFALTATCDGATAEITGVTGGAFAFVDPPADGAVIDTATGVVTGGDYGSTYNISYTSDDLCPTTTTNSITILADDSSFALTATCDGATAEITGVTGGAFAFVDPPADGAVIDTATGVVTGGDYGSTYNISYTSDDLCPTTTINSVVVETPPEINNPTALEVCDDNIPDGLTAIDLTIKNSEITGGNPNYSVYYFISLNDAETATNPLAIPYTNISNPQTIFVRVVDIETGCYATTSLDLVVASAPGATSPSNLEYCDPDADGFGVFTLTDANDEITGGQTGLTVSYYETQADAENNVNAIVSPTEGETIYYNIVAYQQTIYVRVESSTIATSCATYLELLIVVNDVPQIATDPDPLQVCDNDADGFALFDLSLSDESVLNGLNPSDFNITYYESAENANNAINPILTPFAYTNITEDTQQVWVHVENITTGCYNTVSLTLIVDELPVLIQPLPLELCDDNNTGDEVEEFTLEDSIEQVLDAQTGISITFYETQANADDATNPIVSPYTNTSNAQTIYLRGENDITGCYATITLDLRVNPIPSPATPEAIEVCDEDNDGFTFFDIETYEIDIINGELDITLSYYETFANAQNAVEPLVSPYFNIVADSQVIFVRAENDLTGCFNIVEQELVTLPSPVLPVIIEDIIVCDEDYDEITVFDLTQRDDDILGGQTSVDFELTYHETLEDAQTGDNPIINTNAYINLSNPQTIYVRLEDLNNECVSIGEFDLIVALPPVIVQPTPLEECDDELADEITVFDLTLKDDEITGGNPEWVVTYYETQEDAQNATNPIETPEAYTNTSIAGNAANPQTLFVSVVNTEGCAAYTTLTIRVLPNPTPSIDAPNIEACDYDNPGDQIEIFDITLNEAYIINGEPGVSIAYYETLIDAEAATNPIVDTTAYTNITLGQQTIYVRVTNDTTGCFTIVTFDIVVNPLPDVSTVEDFIACEINTDGFYDFDLDTVTAQILGSQDPANFTVTYHQTQEDADNGENALVSPYTNLTNPQQLFVNITNDLTTCSIAVPSFSIEVQEGAAANGDGVPIDYIICDNTGDNDGIGQFDLTTLNEQVLDGQDATNFTVTYYANMEDAQAGVNPLPSVYENTSNPEMIYIRVDNDTTAESLCYDTTQATLSVNLLPEFTLPESYMACINLNGTELVGPTVMEIDLPSSEYSFEWFDPAGNLAATTATHVPLMDGTYTAVATNLITGCQASVTTVVDSSSPAEVEAVVTTDFFADQHIIEVGAVGTGDYEYQLDDGPWQTSNTFIGVSPGYHIVTVRDLNGCGTGIDQVLVIDYPRFFTPNGDGYNDTWQIEGIQNRPLADIYIFDRYGKLLKQLSPLGNGWDGTYNGKLMPSTDYWFTITLDILYGEDETLIKTFKGHFSLKR